MEALHHHVIISNSVAIIGEQSSYANLTLVPMIATPPVRTPPTRSGSQRRSGNDVVAMTWW